jgi:transcription elongation factor S-II
LELSPEELASDARRADNTKIREHATDEAVRGQKKEASTDAFKCGKCKKRMVGRCSSTLTNPR